ncbi:MAG: hypothetical protein HN420_17065, partial [Rhodospirillaceae bacterium]|nr:hypothetical protein [Rhodospirillaceae bacterium]
PISTVIADLGKGELVVNPIVEPLTTFEFFLVHQTRHPLRQPARELVGRLESTLQGNAAAWRKLTDSDA